MILASTVELSCIDEFCVDSDSVFGNNF